MQPFEFIVEGPPVSLQARNRSRLQAWKSDVTAAAAASWSNAGPIPDEVQIQIVYYHEGNPIDSDNMIKPIQDALAGLVYVNDSQVIDTRAAKRRLDAPFRVKGISPVLATGFSSGHEFLHIRIEDAPDQQELL